MSEEKMDIKETLETFRNHWIHENDVRPLHEMEQSAGNEIKKIIDSVPENQLKDTLGLSGLLTSEQSFF